MISILSSSIFSLPKNKDRENQDSVLHPTQTSGGYLMAIADGVGGYKGGKEASETVIKHLHSLDIINNDDVFSVFNPLKNAVASLSKVDETLSSAATTLTLCFLHENGLTIGHIGDCRVYLKDGTKLRQVTTDHTQHQMLIDSGIYTAKELKNAKGKNVITTAISAKIPLNQQILNIHKNELPLEDGILSMFIMSDGAHNFWEQRPRFSINTLSASSRFAASLIKRIETKGPADDYSLIAVNIKFS
ncbi:MULTISPECIES: PP2C family protein-serine/threonine phosphatase [Raoultella]|jgi:protein phosphatase|uniref:PP2C family protein-serine/threonine phosphatase n=1 Tax=Raoultella TaxID=160674 RepID=UPI00062B9E8D|nr:MULTISPECIES: protein phosphatase 2C domain-containing protein [Raoultella]HBW4837889.1 protein phosphatase 2C domain-containing protein [Klebsiella pneumoniae]WKL86046.1 protein phosphatase 2C domain-containing protein [Raoultella ornithinolytica]HBW5972268.1 protein phosphatase 2C domain-containing protein [Klebsiella pneumoniae]HEC2580113.1 protein phosphatase 2C domain-containing protein [Raoultella ornithinolytica]HEC2586004.1 protein phosphatase 2C domain-containing protein [Raoultell